LHTPRIQTAVEDRSPGRVPPRIPVVDLTDWSTAEQSVRTARSAALCDSLKRFGFVRLVGHGVGDRELARTDALFRSFFGQGEALKLACAGVAGGQRGYTPFGREHARDHAVADLKAFFHVGQTRLGGRRSSDAYPDNVYPTHPANFGEICAALYGSLERASRLVLEAIEVGLNLEGGRLADMIDDGNSILRALHYPAIRDRSPRAFRAAPHEDINLITLLPAADEEGLEILWTDPESGRAAWVPVVSRPGEIIADVGDMLARMTAHRLPATRHRVVVPSSRTDRHRYAYPFFAHPRPECVLSVLPGFKRDDGAEDLAPITAAAFLAERLREIGLLD
jgi:isopenicillin N synthase-like dioxygenase